MVVRRKTKKVAIDRVRAAASPFELKLSLNVLEHLGINLYSNVPSVLSEVVANAWDADAKLVEVTLDRQNGEIVIQDNGTGMTADEVNSRFLTVGYRRRDFQPGTTPGGRSPMGRKGIGKLSLFSIADTVRVETVKKGSRSGFSMSLTDIRKQIERQGGTGTYYPKSFPSKVKFKHGTKITLTGLRHRQTSTSSGALRKRVARRFSVIGSKFDFTVKIDGKEVTATDRDYYGKIQYLWTYGDQADVAKLCRNAEKVEKRTITGVRKLGVSGWLGTVKESGQLKDEDGEENLNKIAIFVRGKMAQEDILSDFSERGVYASYLIGEIRVDGLDVYDGPGTTRDDDAATSSRQKLVEDDKRYVDVRDFLAKELKHVQSRWTELRAEDGERRALQIPAVKEWLEELPAPVRKKAGKWLGKLNRIKMDDLSEQKQLIKHAVLGFEFYRLHENLEALDNISDENLPSALQIFQELDGLEANLYGQIVTQRIKVIRTLQDIVDQNALEKAIQKYLFDHLWLIDPSWERAAGTEVMETRVTNMIKAVTAQLSSEEKRGRIDIGYRKSAGEHIIIELKRPDRVVGKSEMIEQSEKYLSGMLKLLKAQGSPNEPISIVFVLGKEPREIANEGGQDRLTKQLETNRSRIVYYDQLLTNAEKMYSDYMQKRRAVDRLAKVIDEIDNYAFGED